MFITRNQEQKKLLAAWKDLGEAEQRTVRLFAEFLIQQVQNHHDKQTPSVAQTPLLIPKPEKESAVLALKRLKKSYPMIEADFSLLEEASQLLLKKVMGAEEKEIVLALEQLFDRRFQAWHNQSQ